MSKSSDDDQFSVKQESGRTPEGKRKRGADEAEDEIEIDVNLPEPPSKKAKRKERRAEKQKTKQPSQAPVVKYEATPSQNITKEQQASEASTPAKQRSDHGIWIGNLPFSVTKDDLSQFLNEGAIANDDITRIHLPPPKEGVGKKMDKNRGFAYIDFTTQEILSKALLLTEQPIFGRNVLIKNAKSFEGRPSRPDEGQGETAKTNVSKTPSKRIFVGNLSFDVTRDEIAEHFGQAGEVEDVFLATFEDSGKCKGFGWVRFAEIEAAEAAVRGFVFKNPVLKDDVGSDEEDGETAANGAQLIAKKEKRRKWFINRLQGRELRREFAEDANMRYKKRFGKEAKPSGLNDNVGDTTTDAHPATENGLNARPRAAKPDRKAPKNSDERREDRRKRHEKMDARKIAPGQAHSATQRASAAIFAGAGKKISFD